MEQHDIGNANLLYGYPDGCFWAYTQAHPLLQLKGHKSVGGMRASPHNAMPIEVVTEGAIEAVWRWSNT